MTYNVFGRTLNLALSIYLDTWRRRRQRRRQKAEKISQLGLQLN